MIEPAGDLAPAPGRVRFAWGDPHVALTSAALQRTYAETREALAATYDAVRGRRRPADRERA